MKYNPRTLTFGNFKVNDTVVIVYTKKHVFAKVTSVSPRYYDKDSPVPSGLKALPGDRYGDYVEVQLYGESRNGDFQLSKRTAGYDEFWLISKAEWIEKTRAKLEKVAKLP